MKHRRGSSHTRAGRHKQNLARSAVRSGVSRVALLLILVGCRQLFGFDDPVVADDGVDAPQVCAGNPSDCTGTTPICDNDVCRACADHGECASSNACLVDGSCASEADVAYVQQGGDDTGTCTRAMPCASVPRAIATQRSVIKVIDTIIHNGAVTIDSLTVELVAEPKAALLRSASGDVLRITGGSARVTISDLAIREATSGDAIQIDNGTVRLVRVRVTNSSGRGLVMDAGSLTMSRCVVAGNSAGGAALVGTIDITNSVFAANGSTTSTVGGLEIQPTGTSRFELNTVANNAITAVDVDRGAINCISSLDIRSSIVTGNRLGSICSASFSLFDTVAPAGTGNRLGSPDFNSTDLVDVDSSSFFRITDTSDAIDSADPTATLAEDIDGDLRPKGAARDIGADERN